MVKLAPWSLASAAVAVIAGVIVLLGYFLPLAGLMDLRLLLMDWAVILAAAALLVGVINLVGVHWRKIGVGDRGAIYSAVTLIAMALTVAAVLASGPTSPWSQWTYNYILVPIESGLMALMAVTLILAFARMLARRRSLTALIFSVVVLFVLATAFAWSGFEIFGLSSLRLWLVNVWAVAGARGILLGVALGAIATGIRVLAGADRPYSR